MANKIYTIGREFGSGGREVGEKLAAKLGIKLYDKELLQQAAKDSGFCEEIFENHDEKPTNSFLYSLVMDTYSVSGYSAAPFLDPLSSGLPLFLIPELRAVSGNPRSSASRINSLPPKAAGGFMPRST